MPNWCENELTITDNKESRHFINELNQYIIDNEGRFFQYLYPMPEYLLHASDKWYNWRVENWGCKWDACETEVVHLDDENNCITIHFNSPWAPPIELYDFLINLEIGLEVDAIFEEEGMGISGTYENGKANIKEVEYNG